MATTNRERVGLALDLLKAGLMPFVAREFIDHYKGRTGQELERILRIRQEPKQAFIQMDSAALLKLMWVSWNEVFIKTLGHAERSLISELQEFRNRWAHQKPLLRR